MHKAVNVPVNGRQLFLKGGTLGKVGGEAGKKGGGIKNACSYFGINKGKIPPYQTLQNQQWRYKPKHNS
jgi:hypothetical protein